MIPGFADIGREKVAIGRYINDSDCRHNAHVSVIGQELAVYINASGRRRHATGDFTACRYRRRPSDALRKEVGQQGDPLVSRETVWLINILSLRG